MHKFYFLLSCITLFSLQKVVGQVFFTLKVFDSETSQPVAGATVTIKGTKMVGITDNSGKARLNCNETEPIAVVSFIGYENEEINLKLEHHAVYLKKGTITLEDVVLGGLNDNYFNTISKIDLKLRPANSSQDLLKVVPGLFIAQHAGGGKAEQIFLRGFDIDHGTDVQVNVDGLPVNMVSHAHGQGYADLHFVIPELVNNVDFGKGPYYSDKGNLNTSGYVSLSTIKNINKNKLQIEAGQFNSFRVLGLTNLLNKESNTQSAYIATEYVYSDGAFISPQHFNRFNLFGKYNKQLGENTQATFSASAFSSRWNASGQIPQRAIEQKIISRFGAIDNTEGGYTNRYNANLQIESDLNNGHQFQSQLFYSRYNFQLYSNFTFFLRDSINGDQIRQTDERDIIGFNSKYIINSLKNNSAVKTTIGFNFRADKTYDTELSYTKNRLTTLQTLKLGDISESNMAVYIDHKIERNQWVYNVGGRLDYLRFNYLDKLLFDQPSAQNKAIASPKVNIQYTHSSKAQFYLKAGKGFHSNDTRVVVANKGKMVLPPAYGSDLGVIFKPIPKLVLNAALWYLFLQQEFVYVGDEGITEPSGRTRRFGIDFSGRYQVNEHLFLDANINAAKANFIDNVKEESFIPLAPTLTSTGGINYQNKTGFNGSLRYKYIKDRAADEMNIIKAKGYFLTDAVINYTKSTFEVGVMVENLLNVKWNEAQFATETRLKDEPFPTTELHFTPGVPFFLKLRAAMFF